MTVITEGYLAEYHAAQEYLKLSRIHAEYLGGLRWSGSEDVLIDEQNRPFAFTEAIAEFVDGFASAGRVIAFGYLLHWMDLFQNRRLGMAAAGTRLLPIFAETKSNWQFAGAFAAVLSDEVPEVAEPPDLGAVSKRLRNRAFPIRWFTSQFHETQYPPARPPLDPADFEQQIIRKLTAYSDDELRTWLRTGRGPIRQAERLAEDPPLPRSLARMLASLIERPRLAGAQPYVPQLVGALALPPRRFVPQELPVGGYSDIVTRGQVEHVLPTQFALDELEFLRRFAENELLYFRREEPPAQQRQELVVLIDQGVRTWGDVRLVLAAAALAFGKQALVRKTPFFLSATSNGGRIVTPADEDEAALGELLEASDLSLNPGLALEQTLETPCEANRDIVLLTHPRSLREEDVLNAARRLSAADRLFAVALDAHGDVTVSEIRHGAAIKLRQFHIDFAPTQPPPVRPQREDAGPTTQWTGDVETVPFPFRLGTESITHFDFDFAGHWLLTVSGQGTLHLWKLDGSAHEMLPRACRGTVMKEVLAVIGVAGGFVVAGKVGDSLILAHYNVFRRHCRLFDFGATKSTSIVLDYFPDYHRVAVTLPVEGVTQAVELASKKMFMASAADPNASLPVEVSISGSTTLASSSSRDLPVPLLGTIHDFAKMGGEKFFAVDRHKGEFSVRKNRDSTSSFTPLADGKACFASATFAAQQLAGNTLAFRAVRPDIGDSITLVQYPGGAILREYQAVRPNHKITRHLLSYDGSRIALLRSDHRIEVEAVSDRSLPSLCTRVGGFTREAQLRVGKHCLLLNLGSRQQFCHLFDWASGTLEYHYQRQAHPEIAPLMPRLTNRDLCNLGQTIVPSFAAEDPDRFIGGSAMHLWAVLDRFGQVAVFDHEERLLAMFIAFRDRHAAWMPDGTRFGNLTLSLGPPSPDAAQRIGQALLRAEESDVPSRARSVLAE